MMKARKFLAGILTGIIALTLWATPAFAGGGIAFNEFTCSLCGYQFGIASSATSYLVDTYETYFNVSSIEGLTNSGSSYRDFDGVQAAMYNNKFICRNCLGIIVGNYLNSSSTTQSSSTNVTASVPSTYSLVVPESVVMSGPMGTGEKVANIPVTIKGDIGEKQQIILTADAPTMRRQGSSDVISTAEISKSIWNRDDVVANNGDGTVSNCVIKAVLTPGEWSGSAVFNCSLATQDDSASDFDNNLIPLNAVYTIASTGQKLIGDGVALKFPDHANTGDTYEDTDYIYTFNRGVDKVDGETDVDFGDKWSVLTKDKTKTSYSSLRSSICNEPLTNICMTYINCTALIDAPALPSGITDMTYAFFGCKSLVASPEIPESVENMAGTFYGCSSLVKAPSLPDNVRILDATFGECSSLTIPPVIPSNVEYMDCIFESCNSLSAILVCNANPTNYRYALEGTKILAVDGSCSNEMKYKLLKTVDEM